MERASEGPEVKGTFGIEPLRKKERKKQGFEKVEPES